MIDITKYNKNNIFAKILRKDIPSQKVFENDIVYAFKDINPQAPVHIIVIPKKEFCSLDDFSQRADNKTILGLIRSIGEIAKKLQLKDGYRVITNIGEMGGQEVPHLHLHLLSGKKLGRLVVS